MNFGSESIGPKECITQEGRTGNDNMGIVDIQHGDRAGEIGGRVKGCGGIGNHEGEKYGGRNGGNGRVKWRQKGTRWVEEKGGEEMGQNG